MLMANGDNLGGWPVVQILGMLLRPKPVRIEGKELSAWTYTNILKELENNNRPN